MEFNEGQIIHGSKAAKDVSYIRQISLTKYTYHHIEFHKHSPYNLRDMLKMGRFLVFSFYF